MSKGKLIIELGKRAGKVRTAEVKIEDITTEELAQAVGAVLNNVINEKADTEVEKVMWKAYVLHDICVQIGFKEIASRLEDAFDKLEGGSDGR